MTERSVALAVVALLIGGLLSVAAMGAGGGAPAPARAAVSSPVPATVESTTTTSTTTTEPPTTTTSTPPTTAPVPALAGCPFVPPPAGPTPAPWHPRVLVPDASLPAPAAVAPWRSDTAAASGKGMWVWQWPHTEGGNAAAVVARASAAGLKQLWVRVGDSADGFYGAAELAALVPAAHAAGIRVIGWGFPYLYDPVGDAAWTDAALAWTGPGGERLDGWSADLERASEGVDMTAPRAAVYLASVRRSAGGRLVIATVYPPLDKYWAGGTDPYPYAAMAPYVDAFAPMIYWECTDPGADAQAAIARLGQLRPVHVIGQAFSYGSSGRAAAPSAAEIQRFLSVSRVDGALGASLWVWQTINADEWSAMSSFRW